MKKLAIATILLLGLLGGLLFALTTASADVCSVQAAIAGRDVTTAEVLSPDQVGQCNASQIIAYQNADADSTATATASGTDSSAFAASSATAYNTIEVEQSNTARDIYQTQY